MLIELDERSPAEIGRRFKIRLTRSTFIGGAHRDAGEEMTVSEGIAADVDGEILAEIAADGTERPIMKIGDGNLPKLLPPAPIPADTPAALRDFAKAEAKLEAARDWVRRIAKLTGIPIDGFRITVGVAAIESAISVENRLKALDRQAREEVAALTKVWRAEMIGAGAAVCEAVDRANNLADEARELGFKIFATRLAPLGLATCKVHDLFNGSAAAMKYVIERAGGATTYFGYSKGKQFVYCEGDLARLTTLWRNAAEVEEQAKRLGDDGRKELARVEKAMSKEAA